MFLALDLSPSKHMFGFDPFSRASRISLKAILCKGVPGTSMRIRLVLVLTVLFVAFNFVTMGAPGYSQYAIGNGIAKYISVSEILGSIDGDYY
jgi:hypothetical protein